ncbi:MAG: site-specific integrase [Bacteroides sp.]|nr:site-specific integrase [Bacteroides sp.]
MKAVEEEKDVGRRGINSAGVELAGVELAPYMMRLVTRLKRDRKYPAAHGYLSALHSFQRFVGGRDVALPVQEVFTPARLKAYEEWLMQQQKRALNTVSDYMRSLRAVYNRLMPPGTAGHDPQMFSDVYTKVVSPTKRALDKEQMTRLMTADLSVLPRRQQAVVAYFLLMFMLRGMPFIDITHLRRSNIRNDELTYHRHKTKKALTMEIPPQARRLIDEYCDTGPDAEYLFPILPKGLRGGWDEYRCYQDALRRFNQVLKQAVGRLLPGVTVSSYTARHTWATVAYHMGVSVGRISQSLGRSSVRVTEAYLKPFDSKELDETNRQVIDFVKKVNGEKWQQLIGCRALRWDLRYLPSNG